jgi:hypothetical protein
MIQGIYGRTYCASPAPDGPLSSWENRLRERLAMAGSTECALIWTVKATPAGRLISRLAPSTRLTNGTGCSGSATGPDSAQWRSPNARENGGGSYSDPEKTMLRLRSGHQINLEDQMLTAHWVTPSARDWKDSSGMATEAGDRSRIDQLPRQMCQEPQSMKNWATPRAANGGMGHPKRALNHNSRLEDQVYLSPEAALWPTVQAMDGSKGSLPPREWDTGVSPPQKMVSHWPTVDTLSGGKTLTKEQTISGLKANGSKAQISLQNVITHLATSGPEPSGSSATTEKRGAPNPAFACWLMGWPDAFTLGVLRATASFRRPTRKR